MRLWKILNTLIQIILRLDKLSILQYLLKKMAIDIWEAWIKGVIRLKKIKTKNFFFALFYRESFLISPILDFPKIGYIESFSSKMHKFDVLSKCPEVSRFFWSGF